MTDDYHFKLREMINYHSDMSADDSFGVLGDSERLASVCKHACMHAHVCSCEAAHVGDRSPCSCTGVAIEYGINS